jgi:hypothetical protein
MFMRTTLIVPALLAITPVHAWAGELPCTPLTVAAQVASDESAVSGELSEQKLPLIVIAQAPCFQGYHSALI